MLDNAKCPPISVVIPTRNRPEDVRRCLSSLVSVRYQCWDVMLIDQSDDDRTEAMVDQFRASLPNLSYRRMHETGQSRARNAGMQATNGEIIAFLDDDCTVASDWLASIASVFQRFQEAALIFGTVTGAPHDEHACFIPVCHIKAEQEVRGHLAFVRTQGIGASMYLRRSLIQRVGFFDIELGPGAQHFSGSDDLDYSYRVLLSGASVVRTPSIRVEHYGARYYHDGGAARLFGGYAYSTGAADMKLLRCRDVGALVLFASHAAYCLTRINLRNLILRRGPSNLEWITMYARGLFASFRLGVDRQRRIYA